MTLTFDAPVDDESTDKRKVVALGAVAALLLAGGGWYFLNGSGSDDIAMGVPAAGVVKPAAVRPAVKPVAKAAPKKTAVKPTSVLPVASNVKLGRDPFKALYVVPVAAPAKPAATTTTGTTSTTSGTAAGTPVSTPSYALQLVSITSPRNSDPFFVFSYGGVKKTVVAAQKFGKYGELVTLNYIKNSKGTPTAALLQVGDDDPVVIRIGEKLTVQ